MNLIDFIGYAAAIIAALIFLPQVIHTIKTRDTKGLSLTTYILLSLSNSLWAIYGLLTNDFAIILAQACLLPMGLVILGYKLKFW